MPANPNKPKSPKTQAGKKKRKKNVCLFDTKRVRVEDDGWIEIKF
jgi:hypothetical protein